MKAKEKNAVCPNCGGKLRTVKKDLVFNVSDKPEKEAKIDTMSTSDSGGKGEVNSREYDSLLLSESLSKEEKFNGYYVVCLKVNNRSRFEILEQLLEDAINRFFAGSPPNKKDNLMYWFDRNPEAVKHLIDAFEDTEKAKKPESEQNAKQQPKPLSRGMADSENSGLNPFNEDKRWTETDMNFMKSVDFAPIDKVNYMYDRIEEAIKKYKDDVKKVLDEVALMPNDEENDYDKWCKENKR